MPHSSNAYVVAFAGLALGEHQFAYELDNSFFAVRPYSPVQEGLIRIEAELNRQETLLEFKFALEGKAMSSCDRCLEPLEVSISAEAHLTVKLVEKPTETIVQTDDEDVILMDINAHSIDLGNYFYEYALLAVPSHLRCADLKTEGCSPDAEALISRYAEVEALDDADLSNQRSDNQPNDASNRRSPKKETPLNAPPSPWEALKQIKFD